MIQSLSNCFDSFIKIKFNESVDFTLGLSLYKNNNPNHLNQCLESIWFNQSLKPKLIIFVYDGYIPKRIDSLVQNFIIKSGCNHTIIRNQINSGLTISLNKMLSITKTKYFARMDTDDISEPDRFYKQVNFLEKNQSIDILGSCAIDVDDNNVVVGYRNVPIENKNIIKMLPFLNPVIHPSVMFRSKSLRKIGGYDIKYRTSQDYALWFEAISKGLKIHNLSETLLQYRIDHTYKEKKNWSYRWNDVLIKWVGIPKISRNKFLRIYALIPIIVYMIPNDFFRTFKKIDPRNL